MDVGTFGYLNVASGRTRKSSPTIDIESEVLNMNRNKRHVARAIGRDTQKYWIAAGVLAAAMVPIPSCGRTGSGVERGRSGDRLRLIGCECHLSLLQSTWHND